MAQSTGIVICQYAGTTLADNNGISTAASAVAGTAISINGSLTSGGAYLNPGWGMKVEAFTSGDSTGVNLILGGKFFTSNSVGAYSETITVALGAATVTSAEYATEIRSARVDSNTVGTLRIGLAADGYGVPVGINHGSLIQLNYGGTFGGATVQVKKYNSLNGEWLPFGTETGEASATVKNYEIPVGTTLKAFVSNASTTTSIGIDAEVISKQR